MTKSDAIQLAKEIGGSPYFAGLYYWRVMVRIHNRIRVYASKSDWWES